jgi:hypothetical protein
MPVVIEPELEKFFQCKPSSQSSDVRLDSPVRIESVGDIRLLATLPERGFGLVA